MSAEDVFDFNADKVDGQMVDLLEYVHLSDPFTQPKFYDTIQKQKSTNV